MPFDLKNSSENEKNVSPPRPQEDPDTFGTYLPDKPLGSLLISKFRFLDGIGLSCFPLLNNQVIVFNWHIIKTQKTKLVDS